jgi:uncharacterized protein
MELISDPVFYALAIPAVFLTGISKGGFGAAFGGLAVPMLAIAISPVQAAAIVLPILCVMDIFALIAYRRRVHWTNYRILLIGSLFGIAIGTALFQYLSEDIIRLILGSIAVLFTANHWIKRLPEEHKAKPSRLKGSLMGMIAGFTSFVAHAGGPPVQFYLLPQKLEKMLFVGTTAWFFFSINYIKLIPYSFLGQFSVQNLMTSLVLLPLAPIGVWTGVKLVQIVPQQLFYRLAYFFLFAVGLKLLWDGIGGLANF